MQKERYARSFLQAYQLQSFRFSFIHVHKDKLLPYLNLKNPNKQTKKATQKYGGSQAKKAEEWQPAYVNLTNLKVTMG